MSANTFRILGRTVVCGVLAAVCARAAGGGIAPPEQGTIRPDQFREGADIFRIRFPSTHAGPVAMCPVCSKPLSDHLDPNFDCRDPRHGTATSDTRRAVCPVCAHEFVAYVPEAEGRGRIDTDFCRHPAGSGALASETWMCPKCGYAALYWQFNAQVDAAMKEFVAAEITPATKRHFGAIIGLRLGTDDFSFIDQSAIPEHLKIENALAVYNFAGADAYRMAKMHLAAAHAYRRILCRQLVAQGLDRAVRRADSLILNTAVEAHDSAGLARSLRDALQRADAPGVLDAERLGELDRLVISLRLAGLHSRLGEDWWSSRYVETAEALALAHVDEGVRRSLQALAIERRGALDREAQHSARAGALFRAALESDVTPPGERLTTVYLVGELMARTGEPARALPWLKAAQALAAVAPEADDAQSANTRKLVALWTRSRLSAPMFFEQGPDAAQKRVEPDAGEAALAARIVGSVGDAPPPAVAEGDADGEDLVAAQPAAKATESCRALMDRLWKGIETYRAANQGQFPPSAAALVTAAGLAEGEMVCPETGKPLFYRKPPAGASKTFIVFHADPKASACKLMLHSDGSVGRFGD